MSLWEPIIDAAVSLFDVQRLWRIYVGVALTFLVIVLGARFFQQESALWWFMGLSLAMGIVLTMRWQGRTARH